MEKALFEFNDYKAFVLAWIRARPQGGRGVRRRIAEKMNCQVAYVSHVLAGPRHFSLEQTEALARYMALNPSETEFFLLLVELARAGTPGLRAVLNRQVQQRKTANQNLSHRVSIQSTITFDDQAVFYSHWLYQAAALAVTTPGPHSVESLAVKLGVTPVRMSEVMRFLVARRLVREERGHFTGGEPLMHIPSDSPLISRLHAAWRMHTLGSLDRQNPEDLHYSGVVSLAADDYATVREILMKAVLKSHDVIRPSASERLCVLGVDFYEL